MANVLIVVDDLEAAKAFFVEVGMEPEGETTVAFPGPARRSSGDGEVMFRSNHPEFRLLEHPRHEPVFCPSAL